MLLKDFATDGDRSTGSEGLPGLTHDWPTLCHLTPQGAAQQDDERP
jgi:hypothetical protein